MSKGKPHGIQWLEDQTGEILWPPPALPPTSQKDYALVKLVAHRKRREHEQERWKRSICEALVAGNSLRRVAEAAGVGHMTVKRIAARNQITEVLDGE